LLFVFLGDLGVLAVKIAFALCFATGSKKKRPVDLLLIGRGMIAG
jgi:hypothetical protein